MDGALSLPSSAELSFETSFEHDLGFPDTPPQRHLFGDAESNVGPDFRWSAHGSYVRARRPIVRTGVTRTVVESRRRMNLARRRWPETLKHIGAADRIVAEEVHRNPRVRFHRQAVGQLHRFTGNQHT